MQTIGKTRDRFLFSAALFLCASCCAGALAHGQTSAQPVPPGVQNQNGVTGPCSGVDANGMPLNPNDTNCGAFAPGFAAPSTNMPGKDSSQRPVTAVVRVQAVLEKPAATPFPMEYTAVGSATMVKARMPRLAACFKAGKALSDRTSAATSTTCLDQKGEVIAYQECKPKSDETPMACSTVMPKEQQAGAVAAAKP